MVCINMQKMYTCTKTQLLHLFRLLRDAHAKTLQNHLDRKVPMKSRESEPHLSCRAAMKSMESFIMKTYGDRIWLEVGRV